MTAPRMLLPETTYLCTRRCLEGRAFLRPDRELNQTLGYCLGVAQEGLSVSLHGLHVSSNHYHTVCTDHAQDLPRFQQRFNMLVARSVNHLRERSDHLWSSGSYNAVALHGAKRALEKMVYTITNATQDGVASEPSRWAGLVSLPEHIDERVFVFRRPAGFFDPEGNLPEQVEVRFVRPPQFADHPPAQFRRVLADAVADKVREIRDQRAREGLPFLPRSAVVNQDFNAPIGFRGVKRDEINPTFSCERKDLAAVLARLFEFYERYALALARFRSGQRDAEFPAGTYLMRVRFGAACADPG